jgi:hypothetical protein
VTFALSGTTLTEIPDCCIIGIVSNGLETSINSIAFLQFGQWMGSLVKDSGLMVKKHLQEHFTKNIFFASFLWKHFTTKGSEIQYAESKHTIPPTAGFERG